MRETLILLSLFCVLANTLSAQTNEPIPSNTRPMFSSHYSLEQWQKEVERRVEERGRVIDFYIVQLRSEGDPKKQTRIAFLLGEYRADQAVGDLAAIIKLQNDEDMEHRHLPLWTKYPAYEALIKIGAPAIPLMVEKLESEQDAAARLLEVSVIRGVYGAEIGKVVLERAEARQTDSSKKAKLSEALKLIQERPRLP